MAKAKAQRIYVIARTAAGRPTLQHLVEGYSDTHSICGVYIATWHRYWMARRVSLLFCKRCAKIANISID